MNLNLKQKLASIDKRHLLILLLLFLLAFGIRANLMKFELFFEFDTYWHARVGSYILQGEGVPDKDPLAYYQMGGSPIGWKTAPVFWFLSTGIYTLFTFGAGYNKELWIAFVKFLPAFYGALIAVAVYFLFKEIYNRKTGYVASFIAAVTPAFVYRTMAGQFEDDSLGFLWMVIGFYFFVKAVKEMNFTKNSIKNAVLSALFFGLMAWTWEMFMLIPLILVFYIITTVVLMWFNKIETKKIMHLVKIFAIVFVLFSVLATAKDEGQWINKDINYIVKYIPINEENVNRFTGEIEEERKGIFGMTVGEENTGYQFFGTKYNALILFPILALLIVLYRFFIFPVLNFVFNLKSKTEWNSSDYFAFIVFYWVAITLFMAYSKLKFTYVFGLGIAIGAGLVGYSLFEVMKSRTKFEKQIIGLSLGFLMLVGVASGTFFMTQNTPNIENTYGWKPALAWLKENTPEDAKMFNWWDEGHWITFIGERAVIEDNRNADVNADVDTAKFILSTEEEEAFKLVEKYGSDYLIFGSDMLEKMNSMTIYAYLYEPEKKATEFRRYLGTVFYCSVSTDKLTGINTYVCGPNTLSEGQMNTLPIKYTTVPNTMLSEKVPGFVYREKDNTRMYLFNPAANNTMITRIWFEDPRITKFPVVYENAGVKIFKVEK